MGHRSSMLFRRFFEIIRTCCIVATQIVSFIAIICLGIFSCFMTICLHSLIVFGNHFTMLHKNALRYNFVLFF